MEHKEQIERIQHYEALLDRVDRANGVLARALEAFEKTEALCAELDEYLASDAWKQDYDDDEASSPRTGYSMPWRNTGSCWGRCCKSSRNLCKKTKLEVRR